MADTGSTSAIPDLVEWQFTNPRKRETRTYQQTELSIEGEARLIGLARSVGASLREHQLDWERIEHQFDEGVAIDWDLVFEVLSLVAEQVPDIAVDTSMVLLGIFPFNEDRSRNDKYEDERAFLRTVINIPRWADLIRTATGQNEYRRWVVPFAKALGINWQRLTGQEPQPALSETSSEPSPSSPPPASAAASPAGTSDTSAGDNSEPT